MSPRMRIPLLLGASMVVAAIVSSCADPVHDALVASLGPENSAIPEGQYHRAGQPCTACHGPEGPAKTEFSLAGTIFWSGGVAQYSGSVVGVNDATVSIVDSLGTQTQIQTNCVGNFYVLQSAQSFAFPILAAVFAGANNEYTARMTTQISRASSCGQCHTDPVSYDSPGHIFLSGGAPPAAEVSANNACPVDPNLADYQGAQ
jgi:cytochrome c553